LKYDNNTDYLFFFNNYILNKGFIMGFKRILIDFISVLIIGFFFICNLNCSRNSNSDGESNSNSGENIITEPEGPTSNSQFLGTWIGNNKPAPHAVDSYTFVFTSNRYTKSFISQVGPRTEQGNYESTETQLILKPDGETSQGWWNLNYTMDGSTLSIPNWEGEGYPLVLIRQE
jgi:hypothetical protein